MDLFGTRLSSVTDMPVVPIVPDTRARHGCWRQPMGSYAEFPLVAGRIAGG